MASSKCKKLECIAEQVGSTPLLELWPGQLPNGCRLFAKAEYQHPTGSHYDRIYLEVFRSDLPTFAEAPQRRAVEVSSGNAGASVAWFCNVLQIPCTVLLPRESPERFREWIRTLNPRVELPLIEEADYVAGAVRVLQKMLNEDPNLICLNHSRRAETLTATREIGTEVVRDLNSRGVTDLHYYLAAVGNGATVVGPARALREAYGEALAVIGFEPCSAPTGFRAKYPERAPREFHAHSHRLYGTGVWGVKFPFIEDERYGFASEVNEITLVTPGMMRRAADLRFRLGASVGLTSLVAVQRALDILDERRLRDKNILVLFYDRGEKYDWNHVLTSPCHFS